MEEPAERASAEEPEAKASPLAVAGTGVILAAILVVAVYGLAHASIRPINPDQKTPKDHFGSNCAVCHTVSKDAKLVR